MRKSGSCTRPPAYSTWSRSTPSKQKSSSTHANMQARPSRADACPRMAVRGRNALSRDNLGWRPPLFRVRAIVEASVSTVSPFDGSSRCMLDTRPVLSAWMLWPPTPPFSPEWPAFASVGSGVFLAMCSITFPIVIWRVLVHIGSRCLCLRALLPTLLQCQSVAAPIRSSAFHSRALNLINRYQITATLTYIS